MTEHDHWYDDVAVPALLRASRRAYATAIGKALAAAGYDDLPRNGAFVVGGIAREGAQLSHVIAGLGVSKQAAGQLVDVLVARSYLERATDPDDRRRLVVTLTERGRAAAQAIRGAVDGIDERLLAQVGDLKMGHFKATLGALIDLE